jgi:hypothetical protein
MRCRNPYSAKGDFAKFITEYQEAERKPEEKQNEESSDVLVKAISKHFSFCLHPN